jgi:uncharacterized protein DUF4175
MKKRGNNILKRLDQFIIKYYNVKILKGSILSLLFIILSTSVLFVIEYFGRFDVGGRTFLFYLGIVFQLVFILIFICYPLIEKFSDKLRLNNKGAATIISKHFSKIQDKLLNIIELSDIKEDSFSIDLIEASVEKKSKEFEAINFFQAINRNDIYNLLRGLGILMFVVFIVLIYKPAIITKGAERIINHSTYYTPKNYFEIKLLNNNLEIERGNDIKIEIEIIGDFIPENVFIEYGGNEFYMKSKPQNQFEYNFKKINNNISFRIVSNKYISEAYTIKVNDVPILLNYTNIIEFPKYTGYENRTLINGGDLRIPKGTVVKWNIKSVYADSVKIYLKKNSIASQYKSVKNNVEYKLYKSNIYTISLKNRELEKKNILEHKIEIIPDLHPSIQMNYSVDSTNKNLYHIYGRIEDDYGLTKLEIISKQDSLLNLKIPININIKEQEFYYLLDRRSIGEETNNIVLKVWDNDNINGNKFTQTERIQIINPDIKEKNKFKNSKYDNIKSKLKKSLFVADELKREIKELKKQIVNENLSEWEAKQKMKEIVEKQKMLQQLAKEIENENSEKDNFLNSFNESSEELKEKQKQINELMEKLMNDEIRDLFKQLEEMLKENSKNDMNDMMKDLEFSYDELEKQLDRNLELLKRFEIEEGLNNQIEDLKKLAEDQKELADENNIEIDSTKQKEIEKDFQEIKREYEKLIDKNKELKNPLKLDDFNKDFENIKEDFEEIKNESEKGNKNKSNKKQKETGKKMEDLASKMQEMMNENMEEMLVEDYDNLRQILDNLLTFSYDQERNITNLKNTNTNDPKYSRIIKQQNDLKANFKIVEDSLNALGERVIVINKVISEELYTINNEFIKLEKGIEDRNRNNILLSQQFVMTSTNNLALLLEEILNNMQNGMGSGKAGCNTKKKKGSSAEQMQDMRKGQESLKNQLQNMINQMKDSQGAKKPGMSKSLSEMLAKQEVFQKILQDIMNGSSIGSEVKKDLQEINKLIEENKRDLIYQKIDRNLLKRQELIVTRLLEAENSEFEREKEKKRKSNENKTPYNGNNNKLFEYKEENYNFNDILNISNLKLNDYYQKKYKDYLLKLTKE